MRELSIYNARRSTSFQILYCVLIRSSRTPQSNSAWEERFGLFKSSLVYRNFDRIDGEPMEVEWNIFPGFSTLQLSEEVKSLLLGLGETPHNFRGRTLFLSMFNDICCGSRDNEKECESNADLVSLMQKDFEQDSVHFIGFGSEKWSFISEDSPQGIWDNIAERMLLELAESGCPIFRATTPMSRDLLNSKGQEKIVDTSLCRFGND